VAFLPDFAARMDWTINDRVHANHNPETVVNQGPGKAPLEIDTEVGASIVLDAAGTKDPDGNGLKYRWFFYPEAGMGIPGHPVAVSGRAPIGGGGNQNEGGIPSAPRGPQEPEPRVVIDSPDSARTAVQPKVAGTAHVILVVEDNGAPTLTSYRRIILHIKPARDAAR
jgi:hypothetical protein